MSDVNNPDSILDWFGERQKEAAGYKVELVDQISPTSAEIESGRHWLVNIGQPILGVASNLIGHMAPSVVLTRPDKRFFSVVHALVHAARREIAAWNQVFIQEQDQTSFREREISGLIVLVRRDVQGVSQFLVQAMAQPGNTDVPGNVLLAPSLQASLSNIKQNGYRVPLWKELGISLSDLEEVNEPESPDIQSEKLDLGIAVIQPKDGGRFLQSNNLLIQRILRADEELHFDSTRHVWATGKAIDELYRKGLVNPHLSEVLGAFRFSDESNFTSS